MTTSRDTKSYLFTKETTVRLEKGVYGLMNDEDTHPSLLAWPLDPALGTHQDLLDAEGDLSPRPALCAIPGHESFFAATFDPGTSILHVSARPYSDALLASGAALALMNTIPHEVTLADIIPLLEPLDETRPSEEPQQECSYQ